jgi:hypothetical protein
MDGAGSVPRLQFVEVPAEILAHLTVDVLDLALGRHGRDQGRNRVDDQSIPRLATVEDSLGARAPIPIVRRDSASPVLSPRSCGAAPSSFTANILERTTLVASSAT